MNALRPLHPEHSVSEAAFVLHFSRSFSEDAVRSLTQLHEALQNELPKLEKITGLALQYREQEGIASPPETRLFGVAFKHFLENGSFDWALRAEGQMAVVNCLAYTRWREIWVRARGYLNSVARLLIVPENPVVSVSIEFIDRFLYEGTQENYPFDEIFRNGSPLLTLQAKNSGALWHINQGWFDNEVPEAAPRALHVLNITAGYSEGEHQTTVHHNCTMQFGKPLTNHKTLFLDQDDAGQCKADRIFNWLHNENKKVLNNLLSDEMLARIGLNN